MNVTFDFIGKVVVITGGGGDLGAVVAKSFHDDGAVVCLIDISYTALNAVAERLGLTEDRCMLLKADVTDENDFQCAVNQIMDRFGRIDIFFNNAGKQGPFSRIENISISEFESCLKLNVVGVLIGLKHILPIMYKQGHGAIVNTASQAAIRAMPGGSSYSVSKAACMKLGAVAALEAGEKGVRINTICPGYLRSRMIINAINVKFGGDESKMIHGNAGVPLGRLGELTEIANLVKFLASDASSYITGLEAVIDGGSTAR